MMAVKEQFDRLERKERMPKQRGSIGQKTAGNPVRENAKAITALLTPIVVFAGAKLGLHLSDEACAGIAAGLTSVAVWITPNSYGTG